MAFKRAFFTVGGFTLLSRVTGFARDVMAANVLGAGLAADVFFVALRLPNLFRRLFAEGAFTISFVPLFTTALKESEEQARAFAREALAILVTVLLIFTLLMMIGMPWLMHVITPGYADEPEKFALAVTLSRITFPYLFLISIAALLGSILNALGRFGPYAAAPMAFNLVQIAALAIWNSNELEAATAQAWAVTVSGVVQLIWLMLSVRRAGWGLSLQWPRLTPRIRRLLKLIGPGALGAGVMQVGLFIDMVLASQLPQGAVSYLSYADRLFQLPVGVIAIAIGTALLPTLSHVLREQPAQAAHNEQNRAIEFGLYLGLPAAVGLALIPVPILAVLFERGAFTPETTQMVAYALSMYALAIPAFMVSKVLTVAFYAREDTRTPFTIALRTVAVNVTISVVVLYVLVHLGYAAIAHAGLAFSTAITAWVNVALLSYQLKRRGFLATDRDLWRRCGGMLVAVIGMGGVLLLGQALLMPYFRSHMLLEITSLVGLIGAAGLVYLALAHLTGAQRLNDALKMLRRRRPKGDTPPLADPE
jgi:putative peptidoglycan lipid II flippase